MYTWGWCSVWMTGSQIQSISSSVPCMCQRCAVIDPAVSSTTHFGQEILFWSLTWYKYPTHVHLRDLDSADTPNRSAPGWHIIIRYLKTLDVSKLWIKCTVSSVTSLLIHVTILNFSSNDIESNFVLIVTWICMQFDQKFQLVWSKMLFIQPIIRNYDKWNLCVLYAFGVCSIW